MTDHNDDFDRAMRARYAQAVAHTTANTRARLREMRQNAITPRVQGWRWVLASGAAAALVLAVGLQLRPMPSESSPSLGTPTGADTDYVDADASAALDENPDLYLWLASNDDAPSLNP